jgi:pimeloyl-ACP methyl ester carboxylesterase
MSRRPARTRQCLGGGLAFVVFVALLSVVPLATATAGESDDAVRERRVTTRIDWRACSRDEVEAEPEFRARMECARVIVPVDYAHPGGRTLSLFVDRRRSDAADALGPLFVNQGGPGFEAAQYAFGLSFYPMFDRFDIIGMDPRGTGRSSPLRCSSDVRSIPDFTSTATGVPTAEYRKGVRAFVESCVGDPNLAHYGSNNVARDMDRIRDLLGADTISYFGKSYGSDLGTAYLGLFPNRVRAAVLDGATDLTLDPPEFYAQQTRAGIAAFDRYLDQCGPGTCAWTKGVDPRDAWNALLREVAGAPIKSADSSRRVTRDDLRSFQQNTLGEPMHEITEALDALVLRHDVSALTASSLDDTTAKALAANLAITCLDMPVDEFDAAFERYRSLVEDPSPEGTATLVACSEWPKPADPIEVHRFSGSGPVVVVSTRGDVPTPYESGVGLAKALGVPVVTWEANSHTAYLFSPCVQHAVNRLLVDLQPLPAEGATCPDDNPATEAPLDEPTVDDA